MTLRPNSCAERDRHRADAARSAVDEHGIAFGSEAALEQVDPDGEQRLGHGRRFDQRQTPRAPAGRSRPERRKFGIAAAGNQRADLLADQLLGALAGRDDLARDLEPEDVRRAGRRRIEASALEHIGPIDARLRRP